MILRSFNLLNICLLLFWLKLDCAVLVNPLILLEILMLKILLSFFWPKVSLMVIGLILSMLFFGQDVPPSSTCQFQLDENTGSREDSF